MKVTFIGAAHEVTGSCTLIESSGVYYLVDCGMEQGKNVYENIPLPVAPSEIAAVILTHAHIDHSGMLPKLYRDGFRGVIYSTEATRRLADIMLRDTAHIEAMEAEWKSRKSVRSGGEPVLPMYDINDVIGTMKLFRGCSYGVEVLVVGGVKLRFFDIGHLLGSACVEIKLKEAGVEKTIIFSGDVGNTNHPIIRDPQPIYGGDYLVLESTYGNRLHLPPEGDPYEELAGYINRAFDRGGSVIIPSFAVGRTQELLYMIREIKLKGLVKSRPNFPVYLDSPLAKEATEIFMNCDPDYFDGEMRALIDAGVNPIWNDDLIFSETAEDSKRINTDMQPKVIISASGMCEAGRIRHHLKHNLWRPENIILFAGYQSAGTLGRTILDGARSVKLFGEEVAIRAEICSLHGTSGHADVDGLTGWYEAMKKRPGTVFVNHGDTESCEALRDRLIEQFGCEAIAPFSGTVFDLMTNEIVYDAVGVPVKEQKEKGGKSASTTRAEKIYNTLVETATELLAVAKRCAGRPNSELAAFTSRIRELINKYR